MKEMLQECLEIFQDTFSQNPNIILENYRPQDGTYYLITMKEDKDWDISSPLKIDYDKKTKEIKGSESLSYKLIKELDYYSYYLESNKAIKNKNIFSANYYSFFFKETSYPGKINTDIIHEYFGILKNPFIKYKNKKESKKLYQEVEEKLGKVNTKEVERIESWIQEHLKELDINTNGKGCFKIFFIYPDIEKTKEAYKRERDRYLLVNIFNNNKDNKKINNTILGVSNNNMGLNSKKPYLTNNNRKTSQPYMITGEQANQQKLFFDYLDSQVRLGNYRIFFDEDKRTIEASTGDLDGVGYELLLYPEKNEVAIIANNQGTQHLKPIEIELKEYISENPGKIAESDSRYEKYTMIRNRSSLLSLIDTVYFYNYYKKNKDRLEEVNVKDVKLKMILINYGNLMYQFLYRGKTKKFIKKLTQLTRDSVLYSLSKNYKNKAIAQVNYYISLKDYVDKKSGREFMEFQEQMKEKIGFGGQYNFASDKECLFGIGQVLRYFLNESNMSNKTLSFIQEYLGQKDTERLQKNLVTKVRKYSHKVKIYKNSNLNSLINAIILYTFTDRRAEDEWIIAGFLNDNYIYVKHEQENESGQSENTEEKEVKEN